MKSEKLNLLLQKLKNSTQSNEDNIVSTREGILSNIYELKNPECIEPIIGMLEDEDPYFEEMYSYVHLIESFPTDIYTQNAVRPIIELYKKSPEWSQILLTRIINDYDSRSALERTNLEETDKHRLVEIINNILSSQFTKNDLTISNAKELLRKFSEKSQHTDRS